MGVGPEFVYEREIGVFVFLFVLCWFCLVVNLKRCLVLNTDGGSWGEWRGEKERGCAPGVERDTGVEEAF